MSNLDLLNDLDIVLMASGGPDLETLVRRGDAALNSQLETLEGRIFAGREVQCIGTRGGEKDWTVEVLNAQVHVDFEVGLTALAARELAGPDGTNVFDEADLGPRMRKIFDSIPHADRPAFYREMVKAGAAIRALPDAPNSD